MKRNMTLWLFALILGVTVITNPTTGISQAVAALSSKVNILKSISPVLRKVPMIRKTRLA
jgi:hypothetical protein